MDDCLDWLANSDLFEIDENGIVKLPILVAGEIIRPKSQIFSELERLLDGKDFAENHEIFVIRVATVASYGKPLTLVIPKINDVQRLIFPKSRLINLANSVSTKDVSEVMATFSMNMKPDTLLMIRVRRLYELMADSFPDEFLVAAFSHRRGSQAADRQLSFGGHSGNQLLDGWVPIKGSVGPGIFAGLQQGSRMTGREISYVRAFPTRQLHVTAGNTPTMPLISCARALSVKGASVIKLARGSIIAGAATAAALGSCGSNLLLEASSVLYWRGGDESIEGKLFDAEHFERVVCWGGQAAIDTLQKRAGNMKILSFLPRYGLSMIGKEALKPDTIEESVSRSVADVSIWNQQACISPLEQFVEGERDLVEEYCERLVKALGRSDDTYPTTMPADSIGMIRQLRRGAWMNAKWYTNGSNLAPSSAVVLSEEPVDLMNHPMRKVVVVRRVDKLEHAFSAVNRHTSVVGVWPRNHRCEIRDDLISRGTTAVLPLGEVETFNHGGLPHDGMLPLSQLVSWVSS